MLILWKHSQLQERVFFFTLNYTVCIISHVLLNPPRHYLFSQCSIFLKWLTMAIVFYNISRLLDEVISFYCMSDYISFGFIMKALSSQVAWKTQRGPFRQLLLLWARHGIILYIQTVEYKRTQGLYVHQLICVQSPDCSSIKSMVWSSAYMKNERVPSTLHANTLMCVSFFYTWRYIDGLWALFLQMETIQNEGGKSYYCHYF